MKIIPQILITLGISCTLFLSGTVARSANVSSVDSVRASRFLVQFPVGRHQIDASYRDNYYAISELRRFFGTINLSKIDSITVTGSASPDGGVLTNLTLSIQRAQALKDLILGMGLRSVPPIKLGAKWDTWPELVKLVRSDNLIPRQSEVLVILEARLSNQIRMETLRLAGYSNAYRYIINSIYPLLRNASVVIVHYRDQSDFEVSDTKESFMKNSTTISTEVYASKGLSLFKSERSAPKNQSDFADSSMWVRARGLDDVRCFTYEKKPMFAVKTNLLFNAATLLNVELEVPIGKHWSVAGEWIFPWWLWDGKQNCIQMLSGNLELKYWFRPRMNQHKGLFPSMTGWRVGLYAGGGLYDFEYQRKGYQGEFYIAAGLSLGYAHSIGRNLRMEYAIGVGYMQTDYRKYEASLGTDNQWHLIRQGTGSYTWVGPTQAKVSLVWMLNRNAKHRIR